MFTVEFSLRFGREKQVDSEEPVYYDLSSAQVERSERVIGFTPAEGWEDAA